jgi:NADP-dependent alcohol dehydrogenase
MTAPPARLVRPTALLAGTGAARWALADVPDGEVAVLYDPAVDWLVDQVRAASPRHRFAARPVSRAPTFGDVDATGAWLADRPGAPLLAVGGGTVLDLAKLGAVAARSPATLEQIRRHARRAGFVVLASTVTRGAPLLALPTTIGTGAEVSGVACVDDEPGHRTLVSSAQLRPDLAILDPVATRTLPMQLVREGALEALLRVAGPEIASPSRVPMARFEAHDLVRRLARALDACRATRGVDDEARLALAQLSSATHGGWALVGRSPFPSPLWFVATELSNVLDLTKMAATALLLAPWLQRVADGDARWGHRKRLAEVWRAMTGAPAGADAGERARAQLERWRLRPAVGRPAPGVVDETARRAVCRWGGRLPMLGRFGHDDIASLVGDALGAA